MRLINKVLIRTSIAFVLLLGIWAGLFFINILEEINDETDEALADYTEKLIKRKLAGVELPTKTEGSNNIFYIKEMSLDEIVDYKPIMYKDSMVFIHDKGDKEPARILQTLFKDNNNQYFELTVLIPTIEKRDLIRAIIRWITILYLGLLLTLTIINVWVFQGSLRPLYRLIDWMDNYKLGGTNTKLENETDITEYQKLNEATRAHIQRSEEIYEEQKLFIGNASHEMQTPLAICNNRIEWLMDQTTLSEEQFKELVKTKQTLRHLVRLNKSLLFLTKIENRQFPEISSLSINKLIKEHLVDYKEIYSLKNIQVDLIEEGELKISMNENLAVSLFTNLLKNAFVHTPDNKLIEITVSTDRFTISNSAEQGSLDKNKLFKRFSQANKKEGSTGLGLVIAKSICTVYNVSINYDFKDHKHCFMLTWN